MASFLTRFARLWKSKAAKTYHTKKKSRDAGENSSEEKPVEKHPIALTTNDNLQVVNFKEKGARKSKNMKLVLPGTSKTTEMEVGGEHLSFEDFTMSISHTVDTDNLLKRTGMEAVNLDPRNSWRSSFGTKVFTPK